MDAYRRYGPALIRKCQRMLQNHQDPEDIVQGLFTDLLRKGVTSPDLPYLYRAVTNRCLNHIRGGDNRRRLLEMNDLALRGPVRTPCDEQVIGLDLLVKLMDHLDDACSEVLVYRYFDDMTQDEIARVAGTSRKTVGKRLGKVKREVQRLLDDRRGGLS